jgi:tRNA pseudouridine55 synthase
LLLDKPADMTSARAVALVKRLTGARKAGHCGTLDPFATGILICCLNQATRLSRFFIQGEKRYEAVLHLGITTDTQDKTGRVTARRDAGGISEEAIRSVCRCFEGQIDQVPPAFSALKHHGVPLYKLARKGTPVLKPARRVTVAALRIMEVELPRVWMAVTCSAGTYIRTLCADIGAALGCGAHLENLRRIASSGFRVADALKIADLEASARSGALAGHVISMADALGEMPRYRAGEALRSKILHGKPLSLEDLPASQAPGGSVGVIDPDGGLIAILNFDSASATYRYTCVFPPSNSRELPEMRTIGRRRRPMQNPRAGWGRGRLKK